MNTVEPPRDAGTLVREWRRARGLSQLELASDAEVSVRHLSFVENGRARPSRDLLLRLSARLKVTPRRRDSLLVAGGYAPLRTSAPPTGPLPTRSAVLEGLAACAPQRVHGAADAALATAGALALVSAGSEVPDAVVLATTGAERPFPAMAQDAATLLGLPGIAAFDVSAGCSGFLYGLATAAGLVASGTVEKVLLLSADEPGTGAGAAVLRAGDSGERGAFARVVLTGSGPVADGARAGGATASEAGAEGEADHVYTAAPGTAPLPLLLARAAWSGELVPGHRVLLTTSCAGRGGGTTALRWPELRVGYQPTPSPSSSLSPAPVPGSRSRRRRSTLRGPATA